MKIRCLILHFPLLLLASMGFGQNNCNCQNMNKDGVVVLQCQTLPVANDNTTQIALSAGSVNKSPYVSLTVRFKDTAIEIDKSFELHLWLEDGNVVDLQYLNGGLAQIENSQMAHGIYPLSSVQVVKLKASNIKVVAIKLTDGLRRSYQIKMNANILSNQLKCIN